MSASTFSTHSKKHMIVTNRIMVYGTLFISLYLEFLNFSSVFPRPLDKYILLFWSRNYMHEMRQSVMPTFKYHVVVGVAKFFLGHDFMLLNKWIQVELLLTFLPPLKRDFTCIFFYLHGEVTRKLRSLKSKLCPFSTGNHAWDFLLTGKEPKMKQEWLYHNFHFNLVPLWHRFRTMESVLWG